MQNFDTLFDAAIAEWPSVLMLPVRPVDATSFIVEGLTELDQRIAARWVGDPAEVLMVSLHWAITTAVHAALIARSPVVPTSIDREMVRRKFEDSLRNIRAGGVPLWTAADRALIARYFSEPMAAPQPHDAEQAFLAEIDARFPYRNEERSRELIVRGIALSANAAFGVLNEICCPPRSAKATPAQLTALLAFWRAGCHHPLAPMLAEVAAARIAQRALDVDHVVAMMYTVSKYHGLTAALAILSRACDDRDGRVDEFDDQIRQRWAQARNDARSIG